LLVIVIYFLSFCGGVITHGDLQVNIVAVTDPVSIDSLICVTIELANLVVNPSRLVDVGFSLTDRSNLILFSYINSTRECFIRYSVIGSVSVDCGDLGPYPDTVTTTVCGYTNSTDVDIEDTPDILGVDASYDEATNEELDLNPSNNHDQYFLDIQLDQFTTECLQNNGDTDSDANSDTILSTHTLVEHDSTVDGQTDIGDYDCCEDIWYASFDYGTDSAFGVRKSDGALFACPDEGGRLTNLCAVIDSYLGSFDGSAFTEPFGGSYETPDSDNTNPSQRSLDNPKYTRSRFEKLIQNYKALHGDVIKLQQQLKEIKGM